MKKASLFVLALFLSFSFMVGSASAATELDAKIEKVMGVRYLAAGTTPKGFDCSGFTRYIFAQFDIDLSHSSRTQAITGEKVAKSDLRAGDLVFFETGGAGISHVGIYVGDGYFIHSASSSGVTKNKLSEKYYAKRYVTARRIMSDKAYATIATEKEEKPVVKKDNTDKPKVDQEEPQSNDDDQDTVPVVDQEES
ncbi:NlpC/P60 family protein [Paenibacillus psychroresistens]|uniref:NlpC/P60 family protein n=1 Tax=Paenibacillus psychroresistens TaxID=1778678 RepID=A0A6B8RTZ0_9BACL|nr:C40 family peptidase [Paenibacillus psychroresistens]QGQ99242.1 NlpC/P60 family protein [Paenibacillus psychroresistens]